MDRTKILAIMGSPRINKNTNIALESILNEIKENNCVVTKYNLIDLNISHCTGCEYCGIKEGCTQKDDMDIIYNEFDNSDIIIFAAPLYFNSVNSLSKAVIDRCQKYWSLKYSLGEDYKRYDDRKGIFISVGGAPYTHDQFLGSIPVMDYFFRAVNADYIGNYFISNTDKVSVKDNKDVREELKDIGRNILDIKEFHIHK
ncbi:MAG TPA: flavodoxin family protein [Tissierellaceae bacterium]|nr:flavodoxin family protein [Tissierellaceae bacterium]